jgi:CubicO group peptidase (beta-lactamase class C family)
VNTILKIILFSTSLVFIFIFSAFGQSSEINALIKPYVETNNFSGSVLIAQQGQIIFSNAYGQMNRAYGIKNSAQTKFYLASVSMIFTSAAIMKLVEEKKLSLDDPLSKYLPDYKQGNRLTLHNLLSQRSGIPAIGDNRKVDYDSMTKFPHTPEKLISYIKDDSLLFAPDSKYNHGRSDYIILAYIIEKITGKSFGAYLKETIFGPLGMTNTGHSLGEKEIVSNLAAGYAPVGHYDVENAYQIDWTSKTGHGSIYSTAEDLNKFATAILNNKLLSKESWQKIFSDYGNGVGYAWFIRDHLDKKRVQMNGRSPGFSAYFGIYPDDKLVVIVLSNNYISLPPEIGKQLAAIAFKKPFTKTNISTAKLSAEQAGQLTGKYKFDDKFYVRNFEMEVSFKDGNLSCSWGALVPVDDGKKQFIKFIQRDYWSDVEFIEKSNGEIEAMMYDGQRGVKIK